MLQLSHRPLIAFAFCAISVPPQASAQDVVPRVTSKTVRLEFVLIPGGSFKMGTRWSPPDSPVHDITLDRFYMSTKEVARGQWQKFSSATKYKTTAERANAKHRWNLVGFRQSNGHPVTHVSYEDAVAFAKWLSDKDNVLYRLPTEAEWEYACRAGTGREWWWGNHADIAHSCANTSGTADGYQFTAPVGSFRANPWGLYDMIGNVWEWCSDWGDKDYYKVSPQKDPKGPDTGTLRCYRGGAWDNELAVARAGLRNYQPPTAFYQNGGFRLVRDADPWAYWKRLTGRPIELVGPINKDIVVGGIKWIVVATKDLGNTLTPRKEFAALVKPKSTPGRFIRVDFNVENRTKEPETFLQRDLYDKQGRKYETLFDLTPYFDEHTIFLLERINPNVPLSFVQVYEVARDASGFIVTVSNLRLIDRKEAAILLGF